MKIAISNIAWQNQDDELMYAYLKQNNINGIEIAPTRIFDQNPYQKHTETLNYKTYLQTNYNLQVVSLQSICFGKNEAIFNSETERNSLLKYIEEAIIFASTLNCNNLVFGCPKNRIINQGQDQIAIDYFSKIGDFAFKHNTVFAFEANPVIYGTNFINTTQQAIEFVKKCNSPGLKVNLDLGTIIYNNEDLQIIENNIKLINHVHISEPYLEHITPKPIHIELAKLLKKANYEGYVSIEMKNGLPISEIQNTIKYIQDVFQK